MLPSKSTLKISSVLDVVKDMSIAPAMVPAATYGAVGEKASVAALSTHFLGCAGGGGGNADAADGRCCVGAGATGCWVCWVCCCAPYGCCAP